MKGLGVSVVERVPMASYSLVSWLLRYVRIEWWRVREKGKERENEREEKVIWEEIDREKK
jgi:hypothetical protein